MIELAASPLLYAIDGTHQPLPVPQLAGPEV